MVMVKNKFGYTHDDVVTDVQLALSSIVSDPSVINFETNLGVLFKIFRSHLYIFRDEIYQQSQGVRPLGKFLESILVARNTSVYQFFNETTLPHVVETRRHVKFVSRAMDKSMNQVYEILGILSRIQSEVLAVKQNPEAVKAVINWAFTEAVRFNLISVIRAFVQISSEIRNSYFNEFSYLTFIKMVGSGVSGHQSMLKGLVSTSEESVSIIKESVSMMIQYETGVESVYFDRSNQFLGITSESKYKAFKSFFDVETRNRVGKAKQNMIQVFNSFKSSELANDAINVALLDFSSPNRV